MYFLNYKPKNYTLGNDRVHALFSYEYTFITKIDA